MKIFKNKDKVNNKKSRFFKKKNRRTLVRRAISMALSFIMLMTTIGVYDYMGVLSDLGISPKVHAAGGKYTVADYTTTKTITIDGVPHPFYELESQAALILYSQAYYEYAHREGSQHVNDVIKIDLGAGSVTGALTGYESIGNDDAPFAGRVYFGASSYTTLNLDCPFFGTVKDSVQIYVSETTTPVNLTITRIDDAIDEPLFARKVVHDSSASVFASWNVTAAEYSDGTNNNTYPFAGFIGELDENAVVNITAINNAFNTDGSAQVHSSSNNIGLFCQTMKEGSELTVSYSGTNTSFNITTANGHAGGLVGQMYSESKLIVNFAGNPQSLNDEISTASGYAGGIVGYNEGGTVDLNIVYLAALPLDSYVESADLNEIISDLSDVVDESNETDLDTTEEMNNNAEDVSELTDASADLNTVDLDAGDVSYNTDTIDSSETVKTVDVETTGSSEYLGEGSSDSSSESSDSTPNDSDTGETSYNTDMIDSSEPTITVDQGTVDPAVTSDVVDSETDVSSADTDEVVSSEGDVSSDMDENVSSEGENPSDVDEVVLESEEGEPAIEPEIVRYYLGAGNITLVPLGASNNQTYSINQRISGTDGAGAVYGYFKPFFENNSAVFDIDRYDLSGAVLEAAGSVGGLFGKLENATANSAEDTITIGTSGSTATVSPVNGSAGHINYGGLIGEYLANETADTLIITGLKANITNNVSDATVTNYGGAIGLVNSGSYVYFDNFELTSATNILSEKAINFGGVVADASGAYIYINGAKIGTSELTDFDGGGLIGSLGNGVLGMTGVINLSNAKPNAAATNGQIVGSRNDALIYAENISASGSASASTWSYTPSNVEVDNVGSWGDVVFFDGTTLAKSDVIASETNHVITFGTANTAAIGSVADYAIVSLLFQINPANNSFINGKQLATNVAIGFTGDITLTGTGLRGITRDNGSRVTYSGTITGNNKTVTLDIKNIGGSNRRVYYHTYNGLIGLASDVTVNNLYLGGSVIAKPKAKDKYIGAFAAVSQGTLNVSGCKTLSTLDIAVTNGGDYPYVAGRFVGNASGMNTINVSGCEFDGAISGTGDRSIGGVFGKLGVADSVSPDWTFDNVSLKGSVTGVKSVGGLAAEVSGGNRATIKLVGTGTGATGVVADGITVSGSDSGSMGGLFGYNWLNTDVEVTKVSVANSPTVSYSGAGGTAGLVYRATGHWKVVNLNMSGIKMSASNAKNIGMIVNKGTNSSDGIYLELPSGYIYTLSFTTDSNTSSATVFDELCAYSADSAANIMKNKQGIVSISTSNGLKMETTAEDSLSYKNQTTQGATANPNTRYYYNLDLIDDNADLSSAPASQLMRWGVYQYACDNVRNHFDSSSFAFAGGNSYDMKGYSWYPVTPRESVTVAGTFKFYNKEFTDCEGQKGTNNKWGPNITSPTTNQHYMMQNGLFYDINNNLTIGTVVLQGNIGATGTSGTGALVYGTVSGSSPSQNDITKIDSTKGSISLDGIKVWNFNVISNSYAPLLINKTGSFVNLQIANVSTTSSYGASDVAGTSLIGYAGATADATYVNVDFTKIKLDARKTADTPALSNHGYPTTKSIFTRATLLERLVGESGTYTYTKDDDWKNNAHNVTYGEEVGYSSTGQYPAQEQWYSRTAGATQYATKYSATPSDNTVTDSFSGFLPYVKTVSSAADIVAGTGKYYQLKVNHQPSEKIKGCGTYNDPYIIESEADLVKISRWISGNDLTSATINAEFNDSWCNGKSEHKEYSGTTGSFVSSDSSDTRSNIEMRHYLCEAYYKIEPLSGNDISITSSNFRGLGTKDAGYRFRGVIVGGNNISVTNKTAYPLIAFSEGSVIKNLTIIADSSELNKTDETCIGCYKLTGGDYTSTGRFYGSVIGAIVGGDNIIDNVQVNLSNAKFYLSDTSAQYVAVGGYVGVIINGGLVFRNMSGSISGLTDNTHITNNQNKTTSTMIDSDNNVWMFVNPVIGRVINGFAVTESSGGYKPREADVTMKNSTGDHTVVKNYSITDIATSGSELAVNTSENTIGIPDSQAFVLMSFIVNSGMASDKLGYAATSDTDYFMRRHAAYSDVGTPAASCDDYNDHASKDTITTTYVPYLIYKYAGGSAPIGSNNWTVNLEEDGDYDLSDGFRGIGNFFKSDDSLRLNVSTFNGNGSTINQNTKYYYYNTDCNGAYLPNSGDEYSGLGLFNCQVVNNCNFSNVILTGSVKCDAIKISDGESMDYVANVSSNENLTKVTNRNGHLSAAMLLATVKSGVNTTLDSVALQNVNVKGVRYTGGLIGNIPKSNTTLTNLESLSSFGITVHGAGTTGGMIGRSQEGTVTIDNNNATYSIVEVVSDCTSRGSGSDWNFGVGGFIGICRGNGASFNINISNVIVGTKKQDYLTEVKCPNAEINTGGMIGILNNAKANLSNCKIYNQSVISQYTAGGLIGYVATLKNNSSIANTYITNVIIECKEGLNCEIRSDNKFAGGFIGACKYDSSNINISDGKVKGYTISGPEYVGGIVGLWSHVTNDGTQHCKKPISIITNNVNVENCNLRGTSDNSYVGGLMGYLNVNFSGQNYNRDYYGYNILENNIKYSGTNKGCVCGGANNTTYNVVKLVGFSRQETLGEGETSSMVQDLVGSGSLGTGGYAVFADYNGDCLDSSKRSQTFSVVNDTNNVKAADGTSTVTDNNPYVTSSTPTNIGGSYFLTSDGVSNTAYSNIAADITSSANGRYSIAASNLVTQAGYITDFASANEKISAQLSTYQEEIGDSAIDGIDFPLLVIDDVTQRNTTALINDYIRLLTNTDYTYNYNAGSNSNSSIFDTVLCRCTFSADNTSLTIASDSCLKMNGSYFYMTAGETDTAAAANGTPQFSLIDVQFKNPSNPSQIAYHLYIPVYVRKLLEYDFNIRLETGTDYVPGTVISENTLLENLGVPVTAEFEYTYNRTVSEWQSAVDGGDNLLANYPKKLFFTNSSLVKNGVRAGFEDGNTYYDSNTKMVLVDSQNGSKAYYCNSLTGSAFSQTSTDNWTLDLQQFADSSGYSFSPKPFNDLMTVTAMQSNTGKFVCMDDVNTGTATVRDNSGGTYNGKTFRLKEESDSSGVTLYNITVSEADNISEHYFLSIFTEADYSVDENGDLINDIPVYHYAITSPTTLGTTPYPSRVDNNAAAHLLTGNIYENSLTVAPKSNETDMYHADHKSGDDYKIEATLTATVNITDDARGIVGTYLTRISTIEIYQSFLTTLNMKNGSTSDKGIKALKNTAVENYKVGGDTPTSIVKTVDSNYAEFKNNTNLRQKLSTGQVVITADVALIFDDEDIVGGNSEDAPAQFYPGPTPGVGTTLIGYSNIASNKDKTAYSKVSYEVEDTERMYYYNSTEFVQFEYNAYADNEIGLYGQLGINANELDINPVPITTLGTYDVSKFQSSAAAADYLQIEVELLTIDNSYDSTQTCNIGDYLTDFAFVTSGTPVVSDTSNNKKWVYKYPKNAFAVESQTYQIPVNYSIYTGNTAEFEQSSRKYSNYEVKMTVSMYRDGGENEDRYVLIGNSTDVDYIKYTNARIYTERVNPNKP